MNNFLLVTAATLRNELRWIKHHLYAVLILSPLVLGMTYWSVVQLLSNAPVVRPPYWLMILVAALVECCLILLSMSRASSEIYHLRRPESFLDAAPVALTTHLHLAFARRTIRTIVVGILALIARSLFSADKSFDVLVLLPLSAYIMLTALAEIVATLNWIHWGHVRDVRAASIALIIVPLTAVVTGVLILFVIQPRGVTLPNGSQASAGDWGLLAALAVGGWIWAVLLYSLARRSHQSWRAADIEYAKRLQTTQRWSVFGWQASMQQRLGKIIAAQLARDLQLTIRRFSSAVYVALGMAGLWIVVLFAVLTTDVLPPPSAASSGWVEAMWLPEVVAVKFACALASASLAALLPVLIAYQLPYLWVERVNGINGQAVWQAKMWYTRLISLPAPILAWSVSVMTGEVPFFYLLPLLAECLWVWWMVSTLMGALSFEMPDRLGLSIIVLANVGVVGGVAVALFWPAGLAIYVFGLPQLRARGAARARYILITGES